MRYFQFSLNTDNKVHKEFMQFGIDFYTKNKEIIEIKDLYTRHVNCDDMHYIIPLAKGILPEFSLTDTKAIIVRGDVLEKHDVNFSGLDKIPVLLEGMDITYYVLWFNEFIDCVDWNHSKYEPWPEGSVLKPWHNPRGRWFWRAALDSRKLPPDLDVFRLKDWSGPFNFIVNEEVRDRFLLMENASLLTNFIELQVISE
jgi:hypothetical protein